MSETPRPFARKYSDEQIAAVVHAVLDSSAKLKPKAAGERAAAGTLPGSTDLPPFGKERREDGTWEPIPEQTIYGWVQREKRSRGIKAHGRLAMAEQGAMPIVLAEAWDDLEKARDTASRKTMTPLQRMKHVREYVATATVIQKAEAELAKHGAVPKPLNGHTPSSEQPKRNTEADALARAARKRASTEHDETAPQHSDSHASGNGAALEQPDTQRDSVARGLGATDLKDVAAATIH